MSFSGGLERARMVYGGVVLCVFVAIAHSALIEGPFRRDTPPREPKVEDGEERLMELFETLKRPSCWRPGVVVSPLVQRKGKQMNSSNTLCTASDRAVVECLCVPAMP